MTISDSTSPTRISYNELARFFLRLGLVAFGGPAAHIALGETEIVERKKWLSRQHYLDLIAATNLIPGPNSTEVMIHVGYELRGIPGAIVSGTCFILPSFLLATALAVVYVNSGSLPQVAEILWGITPVIVAIIANAGYRLARAALQDGLLWLLFIAAALAASGVTGVDVPEAVIMLAAGLVYALYKTARPAIPALLFFSLAEIPRRLESLLESSVLNLRHFASAMPPATYLQLAASAAPSVLDLFWYFLKIGAVLFGSGYVLIAYIQQDVVNTFGWLTTQQLLDTVAIGQVTPGPVSTTASVIGYILQGLPGAVAATVAIFLPAFVLVILTAPLIPRMRNNPFFSAFLTGANAGVVAAILVTLIDLTQASIRVLKGDAISPVAILLLLGALFALVRTKINPTWLIVMGALVGLLYNTLAG